MEALGLRNPETQDFWRFWCSVFLCIFFARFVMQAKDYLTQSEEPDVNPWIRLVQIFSAKFVLEVLGGAGAIWGWSEVITWRNTETIWFWRPISLTVGTIFFCRWILQICDYVGEMPTSKLSIPQLKRMCEIFSAKLVLEVFGGAGTFTDTRIFFIHLFHFVETNRSKNDLILLLCIHRSHLGIFGSFRLEKSNNYLVLETMCPCVWCSFLL